MNTQKIVLTALLSCLFASAQAQIDPLPGKVVKNAPYSAVGEQEILRALADGNQIVNKTNTLYYRDSNGNTRQETRAPNGEVQSVTIQTAADSANYTLIPMAKFGFKMYMDKIGAAAAAVGTAAGTAAKERLANERKANEEIVVKRASTNSYADAVPLIADAYADVKWASKTITKDLGTRNIDGIKAEGKLRTYEIPAGEAGNRKAIVVTDESWYSPELQVTLYSKHSDIRTGEVVFRLSSVKRAEPAAALFSVPSDYKINDLTPGPVKALEDMEAQWKKK